MSFLPTAFRSAREWVLEHVRDPLGGAILRAAGASVVVRIGGIATSYIAHVVLSRLLGLAAYGQYVIVLSYVFILVLPAKAGFDTSALRYSTTYFETGDMGLLRGFIRVAVGVVTVISAVMGASLLLFSDTLLGSDVRGVGWAAALIFPLAYIAIFSSIMRTTGRVASSQFYEQMLRPLLLIIGALAVVAAGRSLTASTAVAVTAIATTAALAVLIVHLRRVLGRGDRGVTRYEPWRQWFGMSVPVLMFSVMQELMNQIDIILLGQMSTDQQAGLFAACWRLASMVPLVLVALSMLGGPMIASAYQRGAHEELQRITAITGRLSFGFALLCSLILAVAGKYLLQLFGPEFVSGYPILLVLTAGGLVSAFTGLVGYLMTMTGHQRQALIICTGALLLSVTLNLLLIPRWGAFGSAIASSCATAAWNLAMLVYVRRVLGIDSTPFNAVSLRR